MADDYLNIGGNKIKLVDLGDGSYGFAADCPDLEALTGALNAAAVTDPTASASVIALLKGVIKQLQGNGTGSQLVEQTGSKLEEQLTQADAVAGVLTFSENISTIEIYNTDAVNPGTFDVNGITITVPATKSFKSAVGGTFGKTVEVAGATTYIVSRYV